MTSPGRRIAVALALAVFTAMAWLGGCSDSPCATCTTPPPPDSLIVSNAVPPGGLAPAATSGLGLSSTDAEAVAYVSLPPATVPTGRTAFIRRVGDVGSIVATISSGGLDPIPVNAAAGDSIDVIVRDAASGIALHAGVRVAATRPPVVVRTNPPRKKRDVPLNSAIVIVFSEPVVSNSLIPSSVRLFRGTSAIAGTVRLLQGTGATAAFIPTASLAANTEYRLEVTQAVQDLQGDALEAKVTVPFTTGESSTGPAASIAVAPDTVSIPTGATYQMTATVRDAGGNVLTDQPVTWSSSNPSGVSVSATGLATALAAGDFVVTATLNGLTASAGLHITAGPPASVVLSPPSATVAAFDTVFLSATVRDAAGVQIGCPSVTWTSNPPSIATAASVGCEVGMVTGVSAGSVTITATSGTASGSASVTVASPAPVESVTVAPTATTLLVGGTRQLSATLRDASGRAIGGRLIAWGTDNAAVATVNANGLVTGIGQGSASVTATIEGLSDTASITVTAPLSLGSVTVGWESTCGLMPDGSAYCWGANKIGELGSGAATGPETCVFSGYPCSSVPVPVTAGLTFTSLTAWGAIDDGHVCGLTTSGSAYCWGASQYGQLGNGTTVGPETCRGTACSTVPVLVSGGLTFTKLSAGTAYTCGVTSLGAAYCWGLNAFGGLGDGTTNSSSVPVLVRGGLTFSAISAGSWMHTCGLTTAGVAYCWGENGSGQLGNGSTTSTSVPVAVAGGLRFSSISVGYAFSCGVATTGAAYCWGNNPEGQLGNGSTTSSLVPVRVSGGLTFSAVDAGFQHACGLIATSGAAYCWGFNERGALGNGSGLRSLVPAPVSGGLTISSIESGLFHTCGVTPSGAAYCWGENANGQLGDGSTYNSGVPVRVVGP